MAAQRITGKPVFLLRRVLFVSLMLSLSAVISYLNQDRTSKEAVDGPNAGDSPIASGGKGVLLRKILSTPNYTVNGENETDSGNNDTEDEFCIPPTIHEFPPDYFTNEQRLQGALVLHFICVIYMFIALAIVCDDYFVPSLEKICVRLGFSEDVAGATFMAAGSSAPELFISIIGVFIAKGDVGVGTIVGSAVFNILVIIGLCGLFAGQVVPLTWWPLFRDSILYSLTVVALVLVLHDGAVSWYESLIMLVMYGGYIVVMKFNPQIVEWIDKKKDERKQKRKNKAKQEKMVKVDVDGHGCNSAMIPLEPVNNTPGASSPEEEKSQVFMVDEYLHSSPKRLTFPDAGLRIMLSSHFPARTRLRTACWMIISEKNVSQSDPKHAAYIRTSTEEPGTENGEACHADSDDDQESSSKGEGQQQSNDDDGGSPFTIPDSALGITKWLLVWPISVLLYFTIPDCRKKRWVRWYMVTFITSIIWIAIFSYIMVWMVSYIGYTLGFPDTIMGLTFLAAGTSVPDAMASLIVARQGLGDMAVSNSIGSNIFDILLGLALPWFLKTTVIDYGSLVHINSAGLMYSAILLFATVAIVVTSIHCNGWKLNKKLGLLCMIFYVFFLVIAGLIEFNIFGYVNPPTCAE
ncbi:sodium/potassium/calcium exchanger 3-like [Ptychodera flava]|uniref:sodium/potassium/calcium exchanger 3-like n=1 Tax=Ptychodera flava TaxID=63121 RepID=UPI00396A2760